MFIEVSFNEFNSFLSTGLWRANFLLPFVSYGLLFFSGCSPPQKKKKARSMADETTKTEVPEGFRHLRRPPSTPEPARMRAPP
jgi:hypothetical protein